MMEAIFWTLIGLLLAYEAWALATLHPGDNHTITHIMRRLFAKVPLALFAFGLLAGHLVWCWCR